MDEKEFQELLREKRDRVRRSKQRVLGSNGEHLLVGERIAEGFAFSGQGETGPN